MLFLANRANLDRRRLLTQLHNRLRTQVDGNGPIQQVWYHTARGDKIGVRARVDPERLLGAAYPCDEAELQVSFDFPRDADHDYYRVQWVERDRDLLIGWHQDETHPELGTCHFQLDYDGETVQRSEAAYLDAHPLNVFDQRTNDLVDVLDALTWEDGKPQLSTDALR
ncbi:MAG: hypothetical protein ABEH61_05745 [Haloarculaceae archaeon]